MSTPAPRHTAGADHHPVLATGPGGAGPVRVGYLVLEQGGHLWAVAGTAVRRLASSAEAATEGGGGQRPRDVSLRLSVAGGELEAHRVLAMVPDLEVTPVPGSLLRFWPEAAAGLAVHDGRPLVVIDPQRPPAPLLRDGPEEG